MIGGASDQDTEIDEIYKNAIKKHGAGKVLGILATKSDNHDIYKREVTEESSTAAPPASDTMIESFSYIEQGKWNIFERRIVLTAISKNFSSNFLEFIRRSVNNYH